MVKSCQPTWFLYYLDDDEENIRKKSTFCSHHRNTTETTTMKDIADTFAETFSANSSINNSNLHFLTFKNNAEKQTFNFKSNNSEKYCQPFKTAELQKAIQTSHNIAIGSEEIHYHFLKHLPQNSLDYLRTIFNDIWINSEFLDSWKIATMILIPKPGRDNSNPANYCPIALTRCLWKTMDRIANKKLVWFLESNKLIVNSQCGFRKRRSKIMWSNWKPP